MIAMKGGGWVTKIALKESTDVFYFFGTIFITKPPPILIIAKPSMGDKNGGEKIENVSLTFSALFLSPNHLHTTPLHRNHRKTLDE